MSTVGGFLCVCGCLSVLIKLQNRTTRPCHINPSMIHVWMHPMWDQHRCGCARGYFRNTHNHANRPISSWPYARVRVGGWMWRSVRGSPHKGRRTDECVPLYMGGVWLGKSVRGSPRGVGAHVCGERSLPVAVSRGG